MMKMEQLKATLNAEPRSLTRHKSIPIHKSINRKKIQAIRNVDGSSAGVVEERRQFSFEDHLKKESLVRRRPE